MPCSSWLQPRVAIVQWTRPKPPCVRRIQIAATHVSEEPPAYEGASNVRHAGPASSTHRRRTARAERLCLDDGWPVITPAAAGRVCGSAALHGWLVRHREHSVLRGERLLRFRGGLLAAPGRPYR